MALRQLPLDSRNLTRRAIALMVSAWWQLLNGKQRTVVKTPRMTQRQLNARRIWFTSSVMFTSRMHAGHVDDQGCNSGTSHAGLHA
jgi:hypothetical protein